MEWNLALTAGLILAAGTLGGALARAVRLPALTGYLVAGVLLGRQGFDVLSHSKMEALSGPVDSFTMALVLFLLGGQFHGEVLKQKPARLFSASVLEAFFTITVVTLLTWIGLGEFFPALLLGILAVAVAPATTLLVLEEYDARGPLTSRLMLFTSFSNFLTVFLFEAALLFLAALRTGTVPEGSVLSIAWDLAGSLLFGLVAGHALILLQSRFGRGHFALPLLTVIFLTIGLSRQTGVPPMLTFLIAGAVVANRSHFFEHIAASIDVFARPAYVVFFVLGGWHLDFALFPMVGLTAGLYVGGRTLGKVLGTHLGLRALGLRQHPPLQAGPGLLCQAGAAIALAGLVAPLDPDLSAQLLNIILAAVAVFELAGPLFVRNVVVAAGEVAVGSLLARGTGSGEGPSWSTLLRRVFRGRRRPRGEELEAMTVGEVMRSGAGRIAADDRLDAVLRFANHSPFNQFPVVDPAGCLLGMITLAELDEVVFDPRLSRIVIAADLITHSPEESSLPPGATIREAAAFFQEFEGNTAAVRDRETGRFLGMIPRSEVLLLARHLGKP